MSTYLTIPDEDLIEIPSPHLEPRIAFQTLEPRKVDNLTLIDGKTFSATSVAGDIYPPGSPDVGFFHEDTRFLSHLELRIGGHRAVVLSSSTEKTFSSQIELTTGNITLRDSFDLPENTVHIRREQLLASEIFFDRMTFENFNLTPVDFTVEMLFDADFVDVFQVRGVARQRARPVLPAGGHREQHRLLLSRAGQRHARDAGQIAPAPTEIDERVASLGLASGAAEAGADRDHRHSACGRPTHRVRRATRWTTICVSGGPTSRVGKRQFHQLSDRQRSLR